MSDVQKELSQGVDPMTCLPQTEGANGSELGMKNSILESYHLGEASTANLVDPAAFLPANNDRLVGSVNVVEKLLFEVGIFIEAEVSMIQKHQKKISFWEERIEKNRAHILQNEQQMRQNSTDAIYDKKNRNYWYGRAEEVETDYAHAEVADRLQDWAWLIKKYGLKNADGTEINAGSACVEELCNGEIKNLSAEYRGTGDKYENARKDKETDNSRLVKENAKLHNSNDVLQGYTSSTYTNEIEPLQDGILLFKELSAKLKVLGQNSQATYGEMRIWAEHFLNDFVKTNSRVPQAVVTQFRILTSIPLPPEYC